jgi:hypothetical protein
MGLLKQKLSVETTDSLRKEINTRIAEYDFVNLAEDVSPFLVNKGEVKRVEKFREFCNQGQLY